MTITGYSEVLWGLIWGRILIKISFWIHSFIFMLSCSDIKKKARIEEWILIGLQVIIPASLTNLGKRCSINLYTRLKEHKDRNGQVSSSLLRLHREMISGQPGSNLLTIQKYL